MEGGKLIDTTRITRGWQITLTERIRKKLNAQIGDIIAYEEKDGEIVIRKL